MSASNADKSRRYLIRQFYDTFKREIDSLREGGQNCSIIMTRQVENILIRTQRLQIEPYHLVLHWSDRISVGQYTSEVDIPDDLFTKDQFDVIYNNILQFSKLLMDRLDFTAIERDDRLNKILNYESAVKRMKQKICIYHYYIHMFKTFVGT